MLFQVSNQKNNTANQHVRELVVHTRCLTNYCNPKFAGSNVVGQSDPNIKTYQFMVKFTAVQGSKNPWPII